MSGNNSRIDSFNRRSLLKGIVVGSVGITGVNGLSMTALAQNGEIPAPFCGEASLPPQDPPGGQAGQCIGCVREVCENEPVAVDLFSGGLSGQCFTLPAEEIPENANFITLKAGQYCFLGEVPEDPEGEVTWCIEQANGQPPMLPDISNATLYTCDEENPPAVDNVDVTCDEIVITTSNIPDGDTITVTVEFSDGTSQTEDVVVQNNQATVGLPGDVDPVHLQITYDDLILFNAGVMASDAPCGEGPAVTDVEVTCAQITIQTANIDEGEQLDVTVIFSDDSSESFMPEVDSDGVAVVELPGDRDPARLIVEYQGQELFDQFVAAEDAPCREEPECPPDLNIAFKFKYGTWWPDTYDDIGDEVDPDVFSIEGDEQEVTICAPFPFAVSYATRTKDHDGKDDHDGWDGWDGHDEWDSNKKDKKEHCGRHDDHDRHQDGKSCDCFDDCKEQEPVLAEQVDSQFCATISSGENSSYKKPKSEICWFRVFCPEDNNSGS